MGFFGWISPIFVFRLLFKNLFYSESTVRKFRHGEGSAATEDDGCYVKYNYDQGTCDGVLKDADVYSFEVNVIRMMLEFYTIYHFFVNLRCHL